MSSIKLKHSSGNSMSIAAPATNPASDLTLTLPTNIGAAGKILSVNGSGNLDFIYPPGYGYFQAYATDNNQNLSHDTVTDVTLTAETFDSQSWYNNSTSRYIPQVAGKYYLCAHLTFTAIGDEAYRAIVYVCKNGTITLQASVGIDTNQYNYQTVITEGIIDLNGSDDYISAKVHYQDTGSNGAQLRSDAQETYMFGYLLEAA